MFSCTSNCRSRCSFRTSIYCRGLSVSFFTSRRLCSFGTSSNSRSWRFSMSFFSRASRWNFSVSFFISYRSSRLFCSSVRRSFSMSFFSCSYRSCRLSCFSTSCYCRLFCMSFFSSTNSWSWGLSVSFFISYRCSFCTGSRSSWLSCFSTSSYSRSRSFCMSFTSSRLIYYRSCRLFSITSCWSSWSITCLICWFRCIFSSTIICINHEVRI